VSSEDNHRSYEALSLAPLWSMEKRIIAVPGF
jgi:hypothetical protein